MTTREAMILLAKDARDLGLFDLARIYDKSALRLGWDEIARNLQVFHDTAKKGMRD